MPYALIIAEFYRDDALPTSWKSALDKCPTSEDIQRLHEHTLLLKLPSALPLLGQLTLALQRAEAPYHVAFFDEKPEFHKVG